MTTFSRVAFRVTVLFGLLAVSPFALADQPVQPFDGEDVVSLSANGGSVAQISTFQGALRSFLLLDGQFEQLDRGAVAGTIQPPAAKRAAGPMDMVSTWDPQFYPLTLNFEELKGPQVTRILKREPGRSSVTGDLWTTFSRDPVFTVVSLTPTSVTMVWPDPENDTSTVFIERRYHLADDFRLEASVRIVNVGEGTVSGRLRLLLPAWEPSTGGGGGCGQSMFSAPPDLKEAVCSFGGTLEKKTRDNLIEKPGFEGSGVVDFAGINSRYFLMAVLPGPDLPSQCMAAGDRSGVLNTMLQWGDTEGKPFALKAGADSCLPDWLLPTGAFAGRLPCSRAEALLGLTGGEDTASVTKASIEGKGPEGAAARASLLARRVRTFAFTAFIGPKDFDALKAAGPGLDDTIDFWVLGVLAKPMLWLMRLSFSVVPSWGIAIIFLTLVVKLLTLYWTQKSMVQMRRMAELKPKIDALREKHKDDKTGLNQATMDLYKREKVNPMGGCLPMLLQMPIWIALYRTIYGAVDLYQAPLFLWIRDLSSHDPYFVLPLVLGGLTFLQQKMTPTAGDPAQAKMMLWMMPIMFTTFMLFLPSGLVFYILVNTLLSIGHQVWMNRNLKPVSAKA
jgi:YidC/Oxa1 family membrane protein insertase